MSDTSIPHIHVFIAYAIEDKKVFDELKKHIDKPLKIKKWEEGNAIAAKPVSEQIQEKLQKADVCIPIISSDLVNSPRFSLLQNQAQQNSQLKVVPILARACNWEKNEFLEKLQILPRNGKPIISTGQITPDEVYTEIVKELAQLLSDYGECEIHVSSLYLNQPIFEQSQSPTNPTQQTSNKRKKWSIIGVLTLIALFAGLYADVPPMLKDFKGYLFGKEEIAKEDSTAIEKPTASTPSKTLNYTPLFEEEDSTHFNILVIRFEDYITKEETYCIGRSIKENLEVMNVNKEMSLPLQIKYVHDSISPPENQTAAILVQKRHFADLIIYGLARNVQENCTGAEVCFRYAIADKVVANVATKGYVKSFKHDLDYVETSPMEIEEGKLQIDSISMATWITALVDIKDGKAEKGLDGIENMIAENIEDLSKKEQVEQYFNRAKAYCDLEQYEKAIEDYTIVIGVENSHVMAYVHRAFSYIKTHKYKEAEIDTKKAREIAGDEFNSLIKKGAPIPDSEYITSLQRTFGIISSLEILVNQENRANERLFK